MVVSGWDPNMAFGHGIQRGPFKIDKWKTIMKYYEGTEIRDVPGFEGRYGVTIDGTVVSYDREVECSDGRWLHLEERELTVQTNHRGINVVQFFQNKKKTTFVLSHLVAIVWAPERDRKKHMGFRDGDRGNYDLSNLYWKKVSGEGVKHRLSEAKREEIRAIKGRSMCSLAREYGVTDMTIAAIRRKR